MHTKSEGQRERERVRERKRGGREVCGWDWGCIQPKISTCIGIFSWSQSDEVFATLRLFQFGLCVRGCASVCVFVCVRESVCVCVLLVVSSAAAAG